jgi:hypothetical protein
MMANTRLGGGVATAVLLLLCSMTDLARAMSRTYQIAAWSTDIGEQIMVANYTTNQIQYSYCNSRGSPVYPTDTFNTLTLQRPLNDHAPIVGAGWWTQKNNNT